jgi:hypothetical protein
MSRHGSFFLHPSWDSFLKFELIFGKNGPIFPQNDPKYAENGSEQIACLILAAP